MENHLRRGIAALAAAAFFGAPAFADDGKKVYNAYCLSCHQADGAGVPGMAPDLNGSALVDGDVGPLVALLFYGEGATGAYANEMGLYEFLSDEETAAVLTYMRAAFGGGGDVTTEDVAKVR